MFQKEKKEAKPIATTAIRKVVVQNVLPITEGFKWNHCTSLLRQNPRKCALQNEYKRDTTKGEGVEWVLAYELLLLRELQNIGSGSSSTFLKTLAILREDLLIY